MLQKRQHKMIGRFNCFEVKAFFDKSVTINYKKAVQLRGKLWNDYYHPTLSASMPVPAVELPVHLLTPFSTPAKVRAPASCCVLLRKVVC
jgi:hypothetical protein